MASIHQNKSGIYHVFFRIGRTQFKPSLETTEEREALNRLGEIERTLKHMKDGVLVPPSNASREQLRIFVLTGGKLTSKPDVHVSPTLQTLANEYFEHYTGGKEPNSVRTERIHTNHILRLIGSETPVNELTGETLQIYANKRAKEPGLKGKKVSPRTVQKELVTFNQLWKLAVEKGYASVPSPAKSTKLAPSDEPPHFMTWAEIESVIKRGNLNDEEQQRYWDCLFLDEKQVVELVEHVQQNAQHAFIPPAVAMAAFTGARRSEILRSQIEDWDFTGRIVRLRGKKDSRTHRTVFRKVSLHSRLEEIIRPWFENHPGGIYTIMVPGNIPRSRSTNGEPARMSEDQAQHYLKTTLSGSKWKVIKGWHVLRHSFCSNCARQGVPDLTIDNWMGHKGDEAIKKRYRHLFPCDERRFMDRLFVEQS